MLELSLALVANLTGMYLLGILVWYTLKTFPVKYRETGLLHLLFTASFVELATHLVTTTVQYYNFFDNQRLGIVMYSFVFTINAVYILAWVLYLNERLGKDSVHDFAYTRRLLLLSSPIFLLLILSILNMFIPIYFSFYDFNYERKIWYYLTLLIPVCYLIYGIVLYFRTNQRKKLYQELPFVALIMPIVIAHILESLFIHLCVVPLSNTIALVILVLMNAKQNAAVDTLSGVYTKSEMYHRLVDDSSSGNHGCAMTGIMIRLEYLKTINDTYGHKTGDQAISDLGFLIRSNLPSGAVAFRSSDDEFVVLLQNINEDEARYTVSKLKAELLKFNQKTATVYQLHISYGISTFEEYDTPDRFIDRMTNRLNCNQQGKTHTEDKIYTEDRAQAEDARHAEDGAQAEDTHHAEEN